MLQLSMNQVGYDARALGFPSVLGCNAIVLQTAQGLCGLHNYGGDSPNQFAPRAAAFKAFVQQCNIAHAAHGCNLYSVINVRHGNRSGAFNTQEWKDELLAFAKALNFQGPITLIALRAHLGGLQDSVYIQLTLNGIGEACKVRYKKWSKMETFTGTSGAQPNVPGLELKRVDTPVMKSRWFRAPKLIGINISYQLVPPNSEVFEGVRMVNQEGTMHKADANNAVIMSGR